MSKELPDCYSEGCAARFEAISVSIAKVIGKLDTLQDGQKALESRVMNGLTERMNHVEAQVKILDIERDRKERRTARWETAVISVIVAGCVTLGTFVITQYVRAKDSQKPPATTQKTP